jgi:hypothetical protein
MYTNKAAYVSPSKKWATFFIPRQSISILASFNYVKETKGWGPWGRVAEGNGKKVMRKEREAEGKREWKEQHRSARKAMFPRLSYIGVARIFYGVHPATLFCLLRSLDGL